MQYFIRFFKLEKPGLVDTSTSFQTKKYNNAQGQNRKFIVYNLLDNFFHVDKLVDNLLKDVDNILVLSVPRETFPMFSGFLDKTLVDFYSEKG
ncbi:MAG: hypothetical protein ACOC30_02165 [Marinilabilia sp.]